MLAQTIHVTMPVRLTMQPFQQLSCEKNETLTELLAMMNKSINVHLVLLEDFYTARIDTIHAMILLLQHIQVELTELLAMLNEQLVVLFQPTVPHALLEICIIMTELLIEILVI
jgi:hypothetical protein